ncbi:hypothetical protein T484DRAFT_1825193 [Baffinella frigidus]|nr:hypothetical protein T484DRAFT_1825193 [Cryptophyta sp. CCMP2293]
MLLLGGNDVEISNAVASPRSGRRGSATARVLGVSAPAGGGEAPPGGVKELSRTIDPVAAGGGEAPLGGVKELSRMIEEAIAENSSEYIRQGLALRHFYFRTATLMCVVVAASLVLGSKPTAVPWHWLVWVGVGMAAMAPWAQEHRAYFLGPGITPFSWTYSLVSWTPISAPLDLPTVVISASTFVALTLGNLLPESVSLG